MDYGDGTYTACYGFRSLDILPRENPGVIPPIDLYLMGLIPPEEVPDLNQSQGEMRRVIG